MSVDKDFGVLPLVEDDVDISRNEPPIFDDPRFEFEFDNSHGPDVNPFDVNPFDINASTIPSPVIQSQEQAASAVGQQSTLSSLSDDITFEGFDKDWNSEFFEKEENFELDSVFFDKDAPREETNKQRNFSINLDRISKPLAPFRKECCDNVGKAMNLWRDMFKNSKLNTKKGYCLHFTDCAIMIDNVDDPPKTDFLWTLSHHEMVSRFNRGISVTVLSGLQYTDRCNIKPYCENRTCQAVKIGNASYSFHVILHRQNMTGIPRVIGHYHNCNEDKTSIIYYYLDSYNYDCVNAKDNFVFLIDKNFCSADDFANFYYKQIIISF